MTDALEGTAPPKPSLRDEANAQRIGRAHFIGHAVGMTLIIAAIVIGLTFAGLKDMAGTGSTTLPNHWVALVASLLWLLAMVDLATRRRHDRNRSGLDSLVLLLLLEAIYVAGLFGLMRGAAALTGPVLAALIGLYLLVVLAILPGSKGENRYGPALRADQQGP